MEGRGKPSTVARSVVLLSGRRHLPSLDVNPSIFLDHQHHHQPNTILPISITYLLSKDREDRELAVTEELILQG